MCDTDLELRQYYMYAGKLTELFLKATCQFYLIDLGSSQSLDNGGPCVRHVV